MQASATPEETDKLIVLRHFRDFPENVVHQLITNNHSSTLENDIKVKVKEMFFFS